MLLPAARCPLVAKRYSLKRLDRSVSRSLAESGVRRAAGSSVVKKPQLYCPFAKRIVGWPQR